MKIGVNNRNKREKERYMGTKIAILEWGSSGVPRRTISNGKGRRFDFLIIKIKDKKLFIYQNKKEVLKASRTVKK